jgi:hypothetical protein
MIDSDYRAARKARLVAAHPTCLYGTAHCDQPECYDDDKIAEYLSAFSPHPSLDEQSSIRQSVGPTLH